MAFGGGKPRTRIGKRIKDIQSREDQLFSMMRRTNTPNQIQVPFFSGVGAVNNQGESSSGFLPTAGGTMIGPVAFFPKAITIASGAISIADTTDNFTSYVVIAAESGTTDDLATITGAKHAGQILYIQSIATDTITLKNATDNIRTNTGADLDLSPLVTFMLIFDATSNKWSLLTASTSAVSGANVTLSNLTTTDINAALLPDANGTLDIGSASLSWDSVWARAVRFDDDVSQPSGSSPHKISTSTVGMDFNVDLAIDDFSFFHNGVEKHNFSQTAYTGINIILSDVLTFNDSTSDPSSNGQMQRNSNDVKVYSGGAVRNFSDIGAAAGANVNLSNITAVAVNNDLDPDGAGTRDLGNSTNYWDDLFVERVRFPADKAIVTNAHNMGRDTNFATTTFAINVPSNEDFVITENGSTDGLLEIDTSANIMNIAGGISALQLSPDNQTSSWSITQLASATNAEYRARVGHEFLQLVQFGDTAGTSIIISPDGNADFNANAITDIANITMALDGDIKDVRNIELDKVQFDGDPTVVFTEYDGGGITENVAQTGDTFVIKMGVSEFYTFGATSALLARDVRITGSLKLDDTTDSYIEIEDISTPSTPSSSKIKLFLNSADGNLSVKKADASVVDLETAGSGGVAEGDSPSWTGTHTWSQLATFNGSVTLGNSAAFDNIKILGRVDSDIVPDDDDTWDLGSPSLAWDKLYLGNTSSARLRIPVGTNLFD